MKLSGFIKQIERHYGHLANKGARERLAQVTMV